MPAAELQTMGGLPGGRGDFRGDAIAESLALLGQSAPEEIGISCCVPRGADGSSVRRRVKIVTVLSLVLLIAGVGFGGVVGFLMREHWMEENMPFLVFALACSVAGISMGLVPTVWERRVVRRFLREHVGDVWSDPGRRPIQVSLEEAQTYGRPKILAEDIGVLMCHPEATCVVLEGVSCKYVIYGKDVVSLRLHDNSKTVLVKYRIGQTALDVAIVPRSVGAEIKRQAQGGSFGLFDQMRQALGMNG